jgi:hypothetical protein
MPSVRRRLALAFFLALAAIGVAACGSSSSTTTAKTATISASATHVVGEHTTLTLDPEMASALKHDEITITAVSPATAHTTLVFPITGGHVVTSTVSGTIEDTGGLALSHAGHHVTITHLIVDTAGDRALAIVGLLRIPVFDLNLSSVVHATSTTGALVARNIGLTLTSQAASQLNSQLGLSTFKGAQPFGTATLTITVRS